MDTIENEINSGQYDIIFTDSDLVTDELAKEDNQLTIITTKKSKDEIIALIQTQRG
jgi:hypothetical protein